MKGVFYYLKAYMSISQYYLKAIYFLPFLFYHCILHKILDFHWILNITHVLIFVHTFQNKTSCHVHPIIHVALRLHGASLTTSMFKSTYICNNNLFRMYKNKILTN